MNIKKKVLVLLEKYPHLRDDDNKLIACIWEYEAKKLGAGMYLVNFLQLLSTGKLSKSYSIERCRRKIQEEAEKGIYPIELAGTKRKQKKAHSEVIKKEVKEFNGELF